MEMSQYEKNYLEQKKKLRDFYKKVKGSISVQEIFHSIVKSNILDAPKDLKKK